MNSRRRFGTGTLISRTVTLQDSFNVLTQEILLGTNPYRIFLIEFSASSLAKKTRRRDSNSAEFFPRISRNVNLTLSTATAGLVASANTRRPQLLPSPVAGTAVLQKLRRRQSLPLRSSNWRLRRCSAGTVAATWLRITELRCRITPAPLRTMLARRAVAENATTDRCTAAMARREEFSRKQKPKTKKKWLVSGLIELDTANYREIKLVLIGFLISLLVLVLLRPWLLRASCCCGRSLTVLVAGLDELHFKGSPAIHLETV